MHVTSKNKPPPNGQNPQYRYPSSNGTEGGGSGYNPSSMRLCTTGGQAVQQQDPKQQPPIPGQLMYPQQQQRSASNPYFQRPRMASGRHLMAPTNVYVQSNQPGIYGAVQIPMGMLPASMPYAMQQQPGRNQGHNASTTAGNPSVQSFYQSMPASQYISAPPAQINSMYPGYYPMRYPPAMSQNHLQPQQQPQQQPPVVGANAPGIMSTVGLPPTSAPQINLTASGQGHKMRSRGDRANRIPIINPCDGKEVIIKTGTDEEPEPAAEPSSSHTPQPKTQQDENEGLAFVADFASRVYIKANEDGPATMHEEVPLNGPTNRPPHVPQQLLTAQPIQTVQVLEPQPTIPTVSALSDSPAVELHRPLGPGPKLGPIPNHYQTNLNHPSLQPAPSKHVQQVQKPVPPVQNVPPQTISPVQKQQPSVTVTEKIKPKKDERRPPPMRPQSFPPPPPPTHEPETPVLQPAPVVVAPVEEIKEDPVPQPPVEVTVAAAVPVKPKSAFADSFSVKNFSSLAQIVTQPTPPTTQDVSGDEKETNGDAFEAANKASQRVKPTKQQKKKDLNKKGVEKEGSDMDAFVEPILNSTGEETVSTEAPTPVVLPEIPKEEDSNVVVEVEKAESEKEICEKVEIEEDQESIEINAMVAVKNEENTKSLNNINNNINLDNNDNEESPAVIETVTIERTKALKYKYKEGNWSPNNPEGKKVYERDLLMELRFDPLSLKKPVEVLDCDIFVKDKSDISNNNRSRSLYGSSSMNMRDNSMQQPYKMSSSSQRGGMNKGSRSTMGNRMGSMGQRNMQRGGSLYAMSNAALREQELNLHRDPNSWKPSRIAAPTATNEEDQKTEELYKNVRGILNKLTPQKFGTLCEQVTNLPIDTETRLKGVVTLIFDKAVDEPSFSTEYAKLCHHLQSKSINIPSEDGSDQQKQQGLGFRKILISKCQEKFEKSKDEELGISQRTSEIEETKDMEKQKELKLLLLEDIRKVRIKSVGLVRFIGELYKLGMLTPGIMINCIDTLLEQTDEDQIECVCKLVTTIGKELESKSKCLEKYFLIMNKLAIKGPEAKVSSRIRFMLQDVIELRHNNWIPRREENKPKTLEQINKDAEREMVLEQSNLFMNQSSNRGNRNNDDRRRNQRAGNQGGGGEEGWHSVSKGSRYDPIKANQLMRGADAEIRSFGSINQFKWNTGSTNSKSASGPSNKSFINNKFSALSGADDRKSGQQLPMSQKFPTSSSSLSSSDRDRQRSIESVRQAMIDVNRKSGTGSGPSSRDSSKHRYGAGQSPASSVSLSSVPSSDRFQRDNRVPTQPPPTEAVVEDSSIDEDEESLIVKKTRTIMHEWIQFKDINDTLLSIAESFPDERIAQFINTTLLDVLENSPQQKLSFSKLLVILIKDKQIVKPAVVLHAFTQVLDNDDLVIDLPFIWKYLAVVFEPLMVADIFNFADLKTAATRKENLAKLLVEIIAHCNKSMGPCWIKAKWDESKVQIEHFIPDGVDTSQYINDKNLGFLKGGCDAKPQYDTSLTYDTIEDKAIMFLKTCPPEKGNEYFHDWLKMNASEQMVTDSKFIKAISRAVVKASLDTKKEGLDPKVSEKNLTLLLKYLDYNEEREIACMYALQQLLVKDLEASQKLVLSTFGELYEYGILSQETIQKWRNPQKEENAYQTEGKGVLQSMLTSFFNTLFRMGENESDEQS